MAKTIVVVPKAPENPVICPGCERKFYRSQEFLWSKHRGRYWHDECWENAQNPQENKRIVLDSEWEPIIQAAESYIKDLNYTRVNQQIPYLLSKGRKVQGIVLTLKYWYEILGNDDSKANGGIGIVDHVYEDAAKAYKKKKKKEKKQLESVVSQKEHDDFLDYERKVPKNIIEPHNYASTNLFHLD